MKHLLYALLTAVSILFTSCGPSSNTNNPQVPNVPQPQPQPQPEVTQKVLLNAKKGMAAILYSTMSLERHY